MSWQPIETAPKDGTVVSVWHPIGSPSPPHPSSRPRRRWRDEHRGPGHNLRGLRDLHHWRFCRGGHYRRLAVEQLNIDQTGRTTTKGHDLKDCPFCGSSPEIQYWHGGGPNKRMISCSSEECEVCPSVTGENERAAIAKWERRA
jgi:hypothetical protein